MARNVTEAELDALLARSDAPRPAVEPRDFHEPRWLSAEDLDALERPARAAAAQVIECLRSAVPAELELAGVDVAESSLDPSPRDRRPDSVAVVGESGGGPSLATLEIAGALELAELALGVADASSISMRELAPLEARIVERLLTQALARAAQAFGVAAKEPRFVSDRDELARVLRAEGDRRRVAVRVAIAIGSSHVVIHFLLAGVVPATRKTGAGALPRTPAKTLLPSEIATTRVELAAVLGEMEIMLQDLLALEAGDLIPLAVAPGEPITLRIEGETCGRARFGERDGRLAVRLTEVLRPSLHR
jgi:flagellar motor switch protein FliM